MDLTTRCPQCGTIFPATLEQLQLRKGYIRCINCAHIFDGYEAVVSGGGRPAAVPASTPPVAAAPASAAPPSVAAAPVAPAPTPVMPSVLRQRQAKEEPVFTTPPVSARTLPSESGRPAFSISTGQRDAGHAARQDPIFRIDNAAPVRPDPVVMGVTLNPVAARDRGAGAPAEPHIAAVRRRTQLTDSPPGPASTIYVEPRTSAQADGDNRISNFMAEEAPHRGAAAKVLWGVLIVAGLLLLLAQLAYVYRAQIANQIPALRPILARACASLDCQIAYSRRIDLISIMNSSLRASPSAADSMTLQFTMRNAYDKPQEWPTMVLDLTDFSGTLVVRKNLAPASYLTPDALQQPFAASSEITVGVPIALNGLKVNGYQLGKFFP